jgi:hypothetical protein
MDMDIWGHFFSKKPRIAALNSEKLLKKTVFLTWSLITFHSLFLLNLEPYVQAFFRDFS